VQNPPAVRGGCTTFPKNLEARERGGRRQKTVTNPHDMAPKAAYKGGKERGRRLQKLTGGKLSWRPVRRGVTVSGRPFTLLANTTWETTKI